MLRSGEPFAKTNTRNGASGKFIFPLHVEAYRLHTENCGGVIRGCAALGQRQTCFAGQ